MVGLGLMCLRKRKGLWLSYINRKRVYKGKMVVEEVSMDEIMKDPVGFGKHF